jgi:aryl-alcohol dehydrogenase
MQIKAAVVRQPRGPFRLEALDLDDPRPDEVRVRMVAAGVCHTDVLVRDQVYPTPLPAVLGHEGAGIVDAVGPGVRGLAPGDHVVLTVNTCGRCGNCLSGASTYCEQLYPRNFGGRRPDGTTSLTDPSGTAVSSHFFGQSSFATWANVAERAVVKVPADVPLKLLGPLGCGIQTGAGAVLNSLRPEVGSSIAVFGAGAVGFSAMLAALAVGCTTIIMIDINDDRLARAHSLGATHTVNSTRQDAAASILELTGGRGVDYALEATGVPGVLRQAADSLAVRGTVGLVGAGRPGTEAAFETGLSITRVWTLKMIIEGDAVPQVFIPRLIDLWKRGRFPFDQLTSPFPFEDIDKAFASSENGESIKPVLIFGDATEA